MSKPGWGSELAHSSGGGAGQFAGVALNLLQRGNDFMHIFLIAQQRRLRNPYCFPGGALRLGKTAVQEIVFFFGLLAAQLLAVFAAGERIQGVQRWIAGLVGNALSLHGFDEALGGDAGKRLAIVMKDVGILAVAVAAHIVLLRRDALNFAQQLVEEAGIFVAARGLLVQARELHIEHGALPLAEPVI